MYEYVLILVAHENEAAMMNWNLTFFCTDNSQANLILQGQTWPSLVEN